MAIEEQIDTVDGYPITDVLSVTEGFDDLSMGGDESNIISPAENDVADSIEP